MNLKCTVILLLGNLVAGQFDPGQFDSGQFKPGRLNAGQFSPGQFRPEQFDPGQFNPSEFNPGQFDASQVDSGGVCPRSLSVRSLEDSHATFLSLLNLSENPKPRSGAAIRIRRRQIGFDPRISNPRGPLCSGNSYAVAQCQLGSRV
ncbi:hypothetical protein PRZ48_007471 [Zasmidium cellare]|uniref:Uncharacterized protein n=1 Tax=Zasmidium cellare TaxID=395010 RepID=A0ABR0EJF6_ZASCE|nr:hypothetical protein PRZ48_007471 [Zasmidium cellare]